jgi:hypothetical protein
MGGAKGRRRGVESVQGCPGRRAWWIGLGLVLLLTSAPAGATLPVSLTPSAVSIAQGSSFAIEVRIGGLDDRALRAWDLSLSFDPALLSLTGVSFGSELGTPCPPGDAQGSCRAATLTRGVPQNPPGRVSLAALSFLSDLSAQANEFRLATLTFTAQAAGSSTIALSAGEFTELITSDLGNPEAIALESPGVPAPVAVTVQPPPPVDCECAIKKIKAPGGGVVAKLNNTSPPSPGEGSIKNRDVTLQLEAAGADCGTGTNAVVTIEATDPDGDPVIGTPITNPSVFCPAGSVAEFTAPVVYTPANCPGDTGPDPGESRELGPVRITARVVASVSGAEDFTSVTRNIECRPTQ